MDIITEDDFLKLTTALGWEKALFIALALGAEEILKEQPIAMTRVAELWTKVPEGLRGKFLSFIEGTFATLTDLATIFENSKIAPEVRAVAFTRLRQRLISESSP